MSNGFKRVTIPHDDPFENVILPRIGGGSRKDAALKSVPGGLRGRRPTWLTKATRAGRGTVSKAPEADNRRRVIAKLRYIDKFRRGAKYGKDTHNLGRYLTKLERVEHGFNEDGEERLGNYLTRDKNPFFGEKSEGISAKDVADAATNDRRTFELKINPYDGRNLVTKEFIRSYMHEVEKAAGTRLAWFAVIHKADHFATKDNLHAHVIIRGRDLYGKEYRFNPEFVKHGFRRLAEDMATSRQGPMNEREIARAREISELNRPRSERLREMDRDGVAMWKKRAYSKEWKTERDTPGRGMEHEGRSL